MPAEEGKEKGTGAQLKRGKLSIWAEEIRAPFLTASILPVLLGTAIAWAVLGAFDILHFVLALFGGVCLHIGTNVANDYFDHRSGADEANLSYVRPFTGGSRIIQRGLLAPNEVLGGALLFFALGALVGLYLAWKVGWVILVIGVIGIFSGFFYTAPPFSLVSRGIGELFVGLNFGLLMTAGAFYVQTAALTLEPFIAAVPLALLIAAVLYINQFQDCEGDRAAGKNHLVVRLGKEKAVSGYALLMLFTYFWVLACSLAGLISSYSLIVLVSLPLPVLAIYFARRYYDKRFELAPANALTVIIHLIVGIIMTLGYVLDGFDAGLLYALVAVVLLGVLTLIIFRAHLGMEKKMKGGPAPT